MNTDSTQCLQKAEEAVAFVSAYVSAPALHTHQENCCSSSLMKMVLKTLRNVEKSNPGVYEVNPGHSQIWVTLRVKDWPVF